MKLISVEALLDGEKLYSSITNCKGIVMLKSGTVVNDNYIQRLKSVGIHAVYVDDDSSDDMEIRPALSDETKLEMLDMLSGFQKVIKKGGKLSFTGAQKMSRTVYDEVKSTSKKPINLVNTYAVDSPVLLHSLNVAVIVAALASRAEIRRDLAESYIFAAMFHDIALEKMEDDTDAAHATASYNILKNSAVVGTLAYMPVVMHHERYDGKGAPSGYAGDKINDGARIIAVADMYDNLIFGYGGYNRLSPYTAVEYLASQSGKALDPKYADLFSQCVAIYPTGSTVLLNTGNKAIVLGQNDGLPSRPVVRLINEQPGDYEVLDLLREHTVFINELYL